MRLKDLVTINASVLSENTPPSYSFKYIDISSVSSEGEITFNEEIAFSEAPSRARRIVKLNDVLISTVRTYLRAIGTITVDAKNIIASTGFAVCSPNYQINPNFLSYAVRTDGIIDSICKESVGVSYPAITSSVLSAITIPYRKLREQVNIVKYLDSKSQAIDFRLSILKKKRDCYLRLKASIINRAVTRGINYAVTFKNSGIEWLGDIPDHWSLSRLKDLGYLYSGLTGKSGDDFRCDDETKTKPFIPFTNVLNNTVVDLNMVNNVVMANGEEQNKVRENDLIFLMSSEDYESIAKCAVVLGNPGEVYLNSFCRGLHFEETSVYAPFVNYQLLAEKFRDSLRFEARGFTRINIKVDRIASQFVALPPLEEQQAIATYLDEKCSKIDAAVANIEKQIDAMTRLKRALINEVITGKREV